MPRTVDARLHNIRREAFLDVAQQLIQTKGYEAMSVQDVLDQLDASRGAFYHYFDSKQALLEAVIDRFADGALAALAPIVDDPSLPALQKLERVFSGIATWKAEQKDLVLAILQVWNADGNAIVREKLRRASTNRLVPILSTIVAQGTAEGTVDVSSPEETARVLVFLLQGFQDLAVYQFIARRAGAIPFEDVLQSAAANTEAFERILGVRKGTLTLMDEQTLHFWFG